jgi:hypothetical protein
VRGTYHIAPVARGHSHCHWAAHQP